MTTLLTHGIWRASSLSTSRWMHLLSVLLSPADIPSPTPLRVLSCTCSRYLSLLLLLLNVVFEISSFDFGILYTFLMSSLLLSDLLNELFAHESGIQCLVLARLTGEQLYHILHFIAFLVRALYGKQVAWLIHAQLVALLRRQLGEESDVAQVLINLVAGSADLRTRVEVLEPREILLLVYSWVLLTIRKGLIRQDLRIKQQPLHFVLISLKAIHKVLLSLLSRKSRAIMCCLGRKGLWIPLGLFSEDPVDNLKLLSLGLGLLNLFQVVSLLPLLLVVIFQFQRCFLFKELSEELLEVSELRGLPLLV